MGFMFASYQDVSGPMIEEVSLTVTVDWIDVNLGVIVAMDGRVYAGPWYLVKHPAHLVWNEIRSKERFFLSEFEGVFGYSAEGKFRFQVTETK